ncbi:MAG: hypothetical protein II951_04895 [Bacteroidales bacterium]|jgi:3-hydroxyacyl-[acyl-carrier-protein] dehydratase|nr:hypothetical protein [Bacteroidales bacterium]
MEDFYTILSSSSADGTFDYDVVINPEHKVFKGHFPGKPVVPGVMSLMLMRSCAEHAAGISPTRISELKDAVYMKPITPDGKTLHVSFTLTENLDLKGQIADENSDVLVKTRFSLVKE